MFFVFTYVDISLGVVVVQVSRNHCSSCLFFEKSCSSCFVHFTLYNAEAIFWKYTIYLWTTKEWLDSIIIVFFWKELQVPLNTDDVSGMVCLVKMTA